MANFFLHLIIFLNLIFSFQQISSFEFILNEFNSSTVSLYGDSRLESNILTLTNSSIRAMGRAFFPTKIPTKSSNSDIPLPFYTSFIFSISPKKGSLNGHGFVFLFSPVSTIRGGSSAQHLGLFNRTNDGDFRNHVLGVEFDVFENQEFNDIDNNHVGIDVNSLTSIASHYSGYWMHGEDEDEDDDKFKKLKLNNGVNYQVWVDYLDSILNVTMAPAGMKKPRIPLLSVSLNLSSVFLDEMYVGFTAATGSLVQTHRVLSWCFSNENSRIGEELNTLNLPSFVPPGSSVFRSKGFIVGISVSLVFMMISCGFVIFFVLKCKRKRNGDLEKMEDWEVEYWPHRISYKEIHIATKGFSDENLIGAGGNGKVYKGVLGGGVEVAVKCISSETGKGTREFLAEVSSLGRLRHRKLVGFRGWCKTQKSLILVFDYMENGSLDERIFECDESLVLSWEDRVRVLRDVAEGVLYLHEGWESKVLHRDIKASNVLLDKYMNGRLGDFGLARMYDHNQDVSSTRVVGTAGYMAPEIVKRGRASVQTDVFAFGVLVLEVICGRRPVENGKPALVDSLWRLMNKDELINALDPRLTAKGGFDMYEGEKMLQLGLLCAYPDPRTRPTMRQALKLLDGSACEGGSEEEGMEVSLLEKMKSSSMWSKFHGDKRHGGHQTFDQIRQSLSISTSLSGSDVILVGR